jgi:hypothetical protein
LNSHLVKCGVLDSFISALSVNDEGFLIAILDAIESLLKMGKKHDPNPFVDNIKKCGVVDKLQQLLNHSFDDVYDKTVNILSFFRTEKAMT